MTRAQLLIVIAATTWTATAGAEIAAPRPAAGAASQPQPPRQEPRAGEPMDSFATGARASRPAPLPPQPTKPSPEVAALGKQLLGAWRCKGVSMRGDGSSTPLVASLTSKLDLDGAWIVTALAEAKGPLKWTEYRNVRSDTRSSGRKSSSSARPVT